jgi:ADP-ribose pyrophosphatase YjhB (NUDIX family)
MNLFINDTPFFLLRSLDEARPLKHKNIIDGNEVSSLKNLSGAIVLINVSNDQVFNFLRELMDNQYEDVSFKILPNHYNEAKTLVKQEFKIVDAAGGVVSNKKNKRLLIYRLKKWDLPKGKLDKGESFTKAAVREVEEETGVKVKLKNKITTTWHTYTIRNNPILKRNKWYAMDCRDDSAMKPQKGENIEKVVWMTDEEVSTAFKKSYRSIRHVMEICNQQMQKKKVKKERKRNKKLSK